MGQEEPDGDETLWYLPHADECLLNESEKKELEDIILTAAESVRQQYENMEIVQGTSYASGVKNFSKETCREVVRLLGNAGYVSVADDVNMENYEEVETFYQAYTKAHDAEVTIFQVHSDGLLGVVTFLCRKGSLAGLLCWSRLERGRYTVHKKYTGEQRVGDEDDTKRVFDLYV